MLLLSLSQMLLLSLLLVLSLALSPVAVLPPPELPLSSIKTAHQYLSYDFGSFISTSRPPWPAIATIHSLTGPSQSWQLTNT